MLTLSDPGSGGGAVSWYTQKTQHHEHRNEH